MCLNRDHPLINNIFLIFIGLSLVLFTIYHWIFSILLVLYILYLIFKIKNKTILIAVIIVCAIYLLHFILKTIKYHNIDNIDGYYHIYDISNIGNYKRLVIKNGIDNIYIYTNKDFNIGDMVYIKGNVENYNYKQYNILKISYTDDITFIKKGFSFNILKYKLNNYIDNHFDDDSKMMIKAFLLADKDAFSDSLNDHLKTNGIMHLFAVSGLHLNLLSVFIIKILKYFKIKDNVCDWIVMIILLIYVVLASFTASITRAFLMYLLAVINKKKLNNIFSNLDIICICFIMMIIINPYLYMNIGFLLSFIVAFSIIICGYLFNHKNKYLNILYISIVSCVASLPVVASINYEINILSPILNVFYISLVSSIILPFTFIVLLCPFLSYFYSALIKIFIYLVSFSANVHFNIRFPCFDAYLVLIYILIILGFILFKKRKIITIIYILFLIIVSNKAFLYQGISLDFRCLNNGEATLIRYKSKNILIDTGDGYKDEMYLYLRKLGIKKIDYVFISHNHDDHYGGLEEIYDNIDINHIVISKYNDGFYRCYDNVEVVEYGDVINIGDMIFKIIGPKRINKDENNNSLIIYLDFIKYNYHILFTGDCMKDEEEDIMEDIKLLEIDCVKIAHHGSNTSSSIEFLKNVDCKYAIIMNSKKWKDVFPSSEVIDNLNNLGIKYYVVMNWNLLYDVRKKIYYQKE